MTISLTKEQMLCLPSIMSGKDFIIIGAAGSGKTTTVAYLCTHLLQQRKLPSIIMDTGVKGNAKLLKGLPGIAVVATSRRAANNIKQKLPTIIQDHCMTIHALLEFRPAKIMSINAEGSLITKRIYKPHRTAANPLPKELRLVIIEEAGMLSTELYTMLMAALHPSTQIVYLGDLNQLRPPFGMPILGNKLLSLPCIELAKVHRTSEDSPILALAKDILLRELVLKETHDNGDTLRIKYFPEEKARSWEGSASLVIKFLIAEYENNKYNPEKDLVIVPFNVSFGTEQLSLDIADYLDSKDKTYATEIITGYAKKYLKVGDIVLYENIKMKIVDIKKSPSYFGAPPIEGEFHRTGQAVKTAYERLKESIAYTAPHRFNTFDEFITVESSEDSASHRIEVEYLEGDFVNCADVRKPKNLIISSRKDVAKITLAYATTCHKAIGTEADNVYVIMHSHHNIMLNNNWFYTAVTRAKKSLTIISSPKTLAKAVKSSVFKDSTLQAKIDYFTKQAALNAEIQ